MSTTGGIAEGEPSLTILVVDDDFGNAQTTAMLLESYGHAVTFALSAESAIPLAYKLRPHMIVLNIGLSGMDGISASNVIREKLSRSQTYLLAFSGWGETAMVRRALDAGFDAFLLKPAAPYRLLAAVDECRKQVRG